MNPLLQDLIGQHVTVRCYDASDGSLSDSFSATVADSQGTNFVLRRQDQDCPFLITLDDDLPVTANGTKVVIEELGTTIELTPSQS